MKNCNAQEIDISLFLTKIIKSTYPKKSIDEPLYLFVDIKICNGKKNFPKKHTKKLYVILGKGSNNQNGNLKWRLPLGVGPPTPLDGTNFQTFFTLLFSFAIESYIYETDFTLGPIKKYRF